MRKSRLAVFLLSFIVAGAMPSHAAEPEGPRPLGNPGTWVTSEDYPPEPLTNERAGTTRFTLTVNEEGLVSDCVVTQSSGTDELDFAACSLITQRARFSPGRDKRGRPVTGTYSNSVRWVIPLMPPPEAGFVVFSFDIGSDGVISNCKIERQEGAAEEYVCDELPSAFQPLEDGPRGKVRRVRILHRVSVEEID